MDQGTDHGCKCPACLESEHAGLRNRIPFRYAPGAGQTAFHLAVHASLPIAGIVLIGLSWWTLAPVIGAFAAWLVNSLVLCPSCAYHHAGVRFCGCYPKSAFPYRQYLGMRWGPLENFGGRSLVVVLTIGPTLAVLAVQGSTRGIITILVLVAVVLFLTSTISCPACRQRSVCVLGRLTAASIGRKNL
jgi:hypothetical protein